MFDPSTRSSRSYPAYPILTQGKPPGLVGMWPSRAFTFIDNHDTGSTLNHWPFPAQVSAHGCERVF